MDEKPDFKKNEMCMAACREETENCAEYKLSIVFGGCMYLSNVSGKCMRPPEMKK